MAIRGRTPERGQSGLTFTHDKCRGEKRTGWLSGDVHVIYSHVGHKQKSKPCEKVLLGEHAPCPGCSAGRVREDLGYVPLRDQTGKPVCVVVRKERILFVAKMDRGTAVYYGKEPGDFESVFVIPSLKPLVWENYFSHEPNDDMSYWLPKFLGVPHCAEALRRMFHGECQPVVTGDEKPAPVPVIESLPPTVGELTVGLGDVIPLPKLEETTRRLDAKKERERKNREFIAKNGKH